VVQPASPAWATTIVPAVATAMPTIRMHVRELSFILASALTLKTMLIFYRPSFFILEYVF
jgi:hypothetical protein